MHGSHAMNPSKMPSCVRWWRVVALLAALACLGVALTIRVIDVQLARGHGFLAQAEDNRSKAKRLAAERGVFLDRYEQPLTWNQKLYSSTQSARLDRNDALKRLATGSADIKEVYYRNYRYPEALSGVLGYVGAATVDELLADNSLHIQSYTGKLGLEKRYDRELRGQDGSEVLEINALGQAQRVVKRTEPQPGKNLVTTIDPVLAEVAYQALGDQRGTVVITEASSGAVLALVNKPTFNANYFNPATGPSEPLAKTTLIQSLFQDSRQLFFNRAIAGAYPPGSVFKLVTALAGLETGAVTPDKTVEDEGVLKVGEYEYRNWYFTQYGRTEGTISLQRAIARSNDIFFYKAAEWIGPQRLAEFAQRFGYGQYPNTELGAESRGLVPTPAWKESVLGERWFLGNTYHYGIGQGDLLVSPLQVSQMNQALAHDGVLCTTHFLRDKPAECRDIGLNDDNLKLVLNGMLDACSSSGTAFPFFPRNTKLREGITDPEKALEAGAIACKTGTAEFGGTNAKGHRNTHAWFVAIVEPHVFEQTEEITATQSAQRNLNNPAATLSAQIQVSDSARQEKTPRVITRKDWIDQINKGNFPKRLSITVLVESDETQPFKEGSREAAPVAKRIIDWIEGARY